MRTVAESSPCESRGASRCAPLPFAYTSNLPLMLHYADPTKDTGIGQRIPAFEEALKAKGKTYEFHSDDGAGHAFMQVDRPNYRPEAAVDAWQKIWAFFGRYL